MADLAIQITVLFSLGFCRYEADCAWHHATGLGMKLDQELLQIRADPRLYEKHSTDCTIQIVHPGVHEQALHPRSGRCLDLAFT